MKFNASFLPQSDSNPKPVSHIFLFLHNLLLDTFLHKCIITLNRQREDKYLFTHHREPSVSARRLSRQRNPLHHVILAEVARYYKGIGICPLQQIQGNNMHLSCCKSRWHHETPLVLQGPGRILFSGVRQLAGAPKHTEVQPC